MPHELLLVLERYNVSSVHPVVFLLTWSALINAFWEIFIITQLKNDQKGCSLVRIVVSIYEELFWLDHAKKVLPNIDQSAPVGLSWIKYRHLAFIFIVYLEIRFAERAGLLCLVRMIEVVPLAGASLNLFKV